MKPLSQRMQLGLVAVGYATVLLIAAVFVFGRYMLYVRHPQETMAAGGMYGAGDIMLEIFIVCLFLVPTFFLTLVTRNSESLYTGYSKVVLAITLTAPVSAVLLSISAISQSDMPLGFICLDRLFASPIVIVWAGASRLLAQFDRPKRLTLYALLIEAVTLIGVIALFFVAVYRHR